MKLIPNGPTACCLAFAEVKRNCLLWSTLTAWNRECTSRAAIFEPCPNPSSWFSIGSLSSDEHWPLFLVHIACHRWWISTDLHVFSKFSKIAVVKISGIAPNSFHYPFDQRIRYSYTCFLVLGESSRLSYKTVSASIPPVNYWVRWLNFAPGPCAPCASCSCERERSRTKPD